MRGCSGSCSGGGGGGGGTRRQSFGSGAGVQTAFGAGETDTVKAPLYSGSGSFTFRAFASASFSRVRDSTAPGCFGSLRIPSSRYAAYRRVSEPERAASTRAHLIVLNDESDQPRRSEEHTSELQSRPHLVCRLLLEKKK